MSALIASSDSRCSWSSTPRGLERYSTGSPLVRNVHALIDGRQEAAAPIRVAAAGALRAGAEHDEARQVLRLAAQAVERPRAEARLAELLRAGAHQNLARGVVEGVGRHRLDDGDVVDDLGQVRQQLRKLGAALAVLGELELRAEQLRVRIDERGPVALEQLGRRQRAVELGELRLVVEQLQVAGRAGHEQEDDVLRARRKVRLLRRERIGGRRAAPCAAGQLAERDRPQADAAFLEEPAPRERLRRDVAVEMVLAVHGSNGVSRTALVVSNAVGSADLTND